MRRVVVTGIGMVSPVGANVDDSWSNLLAGKSGATRVTRMDVSDMACKVGCEVKTGDGTDGTFNCDDWMEPKEQRRYDTFIKYGYSAAKMAVRDSGWKPETDEDHWRTGVLIGSGIGGLPSIEATTHLLGEKARGVSARSLFPALSSTWCLALYLANSVSRGQIIRL